MKYSTSLDTSAKAITIGVTILFAIIIFGQYALVSEEDVNFPIYIAIALLLIYLLAFSLRPIHYVITSQQVSVHRLFSDVKIERNKIRSVELLNKDQLGWTIRTFGVGGLFGYYGKFANSKIGTMTWYTTRQDRTILIRTVDDKKIILTPDDPEKFVADFNA